MSISDNWRSVWERKGAEAGDATPDLEALLQANGYDTGCSDVTPAAWNSYVDRVLGRLGASAGQTLFEVGCGAGAFLFSSHERGLTVAGCDYSSTLVALAAKALPDSDIECRQASEIPTSPQYDFVISAGVFHYFSDLEYAQAVINAMAKKARHGVAVLDVPDIAHREANLQLRYQLAGSKEAHEKRYSGLDHLHYEREWVVQAIHNAGLSSVDVRDLDIQGYANAPSRFSVYAQVA
ncbi:class I SAM-dependent methyltransferase [Mycobacterium sp. NPDC048908]|uniref:class I SAM-dependent methyltransferase n=1 Tax=Mycobacterium sp. NPDC048908 TaxID=3364292 RepID=UPI00371088A0